MVRIQVEQFEGVLKEAFRTSPASPCWYPGSQQRYDSFLAAHPSCDLVHSTTPEGTTYSALPHKPACAAAAVAFAAP